MVCISWCRSTRGAGWIPARLLWKLSLASLGILCCVKGQRVHDFSPVMLLGLHLPGDFSAIVCLTASLVHSSQAFALCRVSLPSQTKHIYLVGHTAVELGNAFRASRRCRKPLPCVCLACRIVTTVLLSALPCAKCGLDVIFVWEFFLF